MATKRIELADENDEAWEPCSDSSRKLPIAQNHSGALRTLEPVVVLGAILAPQIQLCSHALVEQAHFSRGVVIQVAPDGLLALLVDVQITDVKKIWNDAAHAEEQTRSFEEVLVDVLGGVGASQLRKEGLALSACVGLLLQPVLLRGLEDFHCGERCNFAKPALARKGGAVDRQMRCLTQKGDVGKRVLANLIEQGEGAIRIIQCYWGSWCWPWQLQPQE
eukprot:6209281-Pleurochrysis_carterae.AAC.1